MNPDEKSAKEVIELINKNYNKSWYVEKRFDGIWIHGNNTKFSMDNWRDAYIFLAAMEYSLLYGANFQ